MSQNGDRGLDTGRFMGCSSANNPHNVEDLLGFFQGSWRLERKVNDSLLDQEGECAGDAHFTLTTHGGKQALNYREESDLNIADLQTLSVSEYLLAFSAPSMAEVRFPDGRFFHLLDLTKGIVRVDHQCGDDTYHGLFRVLSADSWLSVWRILGPQKSQVITTRYLRAAQSN